MVCGEKSEKMTATQTLTEIKLSEDIRITGLLAGQTSQLELRGRLSIRH